VGPAPVEPEAYPALLKALVRSRQWVEDLIAGRASSLTAIAPRAGLSRRYVARLLPLAFLAPAIVEAAIAGQPPLGLTAEQLTRHIALPLDWDEQQYTHSVWMSLALQKQA
jgi:ABC-type nitrate/sulfonate/bicarbonate transport system substrate-binding protein